MRAMRTPSMVAFCVGFFAAVGGCGNSPDASVNPGNAGSGAAGSGTGGTAGQGGAAPQAGGSTGAGARGGSAGTGGSGIIGSTPGNGASDGGSGALNADAACVATAQQGEQRPIALLFMVDNSGSMTTRDPGQTQTRWELISAAIPDFLVAPQNAGLFVGLDFFPEPVPVVADAGRGGGQGNNNNNALCNVTDYENLDVPIGVLPGVNNGQVGAFANAIFTRAVQGNTPTTPALAGALASATAWQIAHPDQIVGVVFVTDGQPNGCNPNTVATAAAAAAAATSATPPIRTYVLGVGPDVGNLDSIAAAGGTGPTAYLVTTGGAAALTAALDAIKGSAVSCEYKVPQVNGQLPDFTQVNVQTRVGSSGAPSSVFNVPNAAACGTDPGWYYDVPVTQGGPSPTTITLCPASCDPIKMAPNSQLQVLLGCKTDIRIR
jgi:hypothetical protein